MVGGGQIRAVTSSSGKAGTIAVSATGSILITPDQFTAFPTGILRGTRRKKGSSGDAGVIFLAADGTVEVKDGAVINSSSSGFGQPGDVVLDVGRLLVDGAAVGSVATGPVASPEDLKGGDVLIIGRESILLSGQPDRVAGVSTDTRNWRNGGAIQIFTPSLHLRQNALVSSSTLGPGDAGTVWIQTDRLVIGPNGVISSASPDQFASGKSGTVLIDATDTIDIEGDPAGITGVTTLTATMGAAGPIQIDTAHLRVANAGEISSATFGAGAGGTIGITADRVERSVVG